MLEQHELSKNRNRKVTFSLYLMLALVSFAFTFNNDVLAAGPSLGESGRMSKNVKNQALRQEIIEIIENDRGCDQISISKVLGKYIKAGDKISKTRKVLAENGFKVRNSKDMEIDHWFSPDQLKRKTDLPFVSGARLLITIGHNGAASGKNGYVSSAAGKVRPCVVSGNIKSEHAGEQTLRDELLEIAKEVTRCGLIDVGEVLKKYVKTGDKIAMLEKFFADNGFEIVDKRKMRMHYMLSSEELGAKPSFPITLWSSVEATITHDSKKISVDGYIRHCLKR